MKHLIEFCKYASGFLIVTTAAVYFGAMFANRYYYVTGVGL